MNRRQFLGAAMVVGAAGGEVRAAVGGRRVGRDRGTFALDGTRVRFFTPQVDRPSRIWMMADTHLFRDDARGDAYRQYSGRMAKAYNQTKHFQTGAGTNPEECFEKGLKQAREAKADLVALVGDILSFPSEAAVEWVMQRVGESGLPCAYVAGNHDWHYEGMEGSLEELRSTWITKRLRGLYQGMDPLMQVRDVGGVRVVMLDNSHYEILPEQLEFYRSQVATRKPLILMVHIPLYAPGRSVGFGCGHPEWGAGTDKSFELERRRRWPEGGHTKVTRAFHREVFSTRNLLGIFAGHIHRPSLDVVNGVPQFVTEANAVGGYLEIEMVPV